MKQELLKNNKKIFFVIISQKYKEKCSLNQNKKEKF